MNICDVNSFNIKTIMKIFHENIYSLLFAPSWLENEHKHYKPVDIMKLWSKSYNFTT